MSGGSGKRSVAVEGVGEGLIFKFVSSFSYSCKQLYEKEEIDKGKTCVFGSGYIGLGNCS